MGEGCGCRIEAERLYPLKPGKVTGLTIVKCALCQAAPQLKAALEQVYALRPLHAADIPLGTSGHARQYHAALGQAIAYAQVGLTATESKEEVGR